MTEHEVSPVDPSILPVETWFRSYLPGRRFSKRLTEGRVVFLLQSEQRTLRLCAVLRHSGCSINAFEPRDLPKLLIRGPVSDWARYIESADPNYLSALDFYGDARLWTTMIKVVQTKSSPLAVRCRDN